jgi:hypothetical protein
VRSESINCGEWKGEKEPRKWVVGKRKAKMGRVGRRIGVADENNERKSKDKQVNKNENEE